MNYNNPNLNDYLCAKKFKRVIDIGVTMNGWAWASEYVSHYVDIAWSTNVDIAWSTIDPHYEEYQ